MKMLHNLLGTAASVATLVANLSGWFILIALLVFSVLFSGCSKEDLYTAKKLASSADCEIEVTATPVLCGWGAFENIWLLKKDGTYLQPWVNDTGVNSLVKGQRYKVSYTPVKKDDRYKDIITCMAATPPAEPVKLTCIISASN